MSHDELVGCTVNVINGLLSKWNDWKETNVALATDPLVNK